MRLTVFSDYTMRVLICLALSDKRLTQIGEIAEAYEISKAHLVKVVQFLSAQGYIETVQGKNGGIRLVARPANVNIGSLIRACERDSALVQCFKKKPSENRCRIKKACRLRSILESATEAFFAELDRYTLADLLENRDELAPLLFRPRSRKAAAPTMES